MPFLSFIIVCTNYAFVKIAQIGLYAVVIILFTIGKKIMDTCACVNNLNAFCLVFVRFVFY